MLCLSCKRLNKLKYNINTVTRDITYFKIHVLLVNSEAIFKYLNTVRVVFCFYLMKSARCNGRNVVEFFNKYYACYIC